MERLTKRAAILGVVFIALGGVFMTLARADKISRTETWMEGKAPGSFGDFKVRRDPDNPESTVSYRMDDMTYQTLVPYGIVARIFESATQAYDAVVIASSDKDSFHDPRVCFTAQGWVIDSEETATLKTKTRGEVPVTLAQLSHKDKGRRWTIFAYKGPDGFTATTSALKIQMLAHQLKTLKNAEGVFYRFIPIYGTTTKEQLMDFVSSWLDEANKTSDGYF
ncbi:MAG TPA: exosortase-associated EpsI family protein [Fimbriimonadaceae bacterium]|nr:exosortase-associated EpsI family protein [Fimbriimonadaceae bacterium]